MSDRMRAEFAPAAAYSDAIVRPLCSKCGTATILVGIEPDLDPDRPDYDLHTFQCPKCDHFETAVGKAGRRFTKSVHDCVYWPATG